MHCFPILLIQLPRGATFNDNLFWILGCLIALQVSDFWSSITITDDIMYPIGCSFVHIFNTISCTYFGMWNCFASFNTWGFVVSFASFCWIVTWPICFYILQVSMQFMLFLFHFSSWSINCCKLKSLWYLFHSNISILTTYQPILNLYNQENKFTQ